MTTGKKLKIELGLENFKNVKVARAIISAYKILFVWYDSFRPNIPITNHKIKQWPWTTMIYHGSNLLKGYNSKTSFAPPIPIENFNGELRNALVIAVDLVGNNWIQPKSFTKKFEKDNKYPKIKTFFNYKECVTMGDLAKNQGSSSMSMKFKKQRNKVMGSETKVSKYIECEVTPEGHVDFKFLSESTDVYPPDFERNSAEIENDYIMSPNPSKTYQITIRVLNVLDWLEAFPDKKEITLKDIKDILDISYIQIDSEVPAFYWQGGAYYLQQLDGTIYDKPIITPTFWNQDKYHGKDNFFIDKITQSIINQVAFYRNQMAVSLTKKLKQLGHL